MALLAKVLRIDDANARGKCRQGAHDRVPRKLRIFNLRAPAVRAANGLGNGALMRTLCRKRRKKRELRNGSFNLLRRNSHAELRMSMRGEKPQSLICSFIQQR